MLAPSAVLFHESSWPFLRSAGQCRDVTPRLEARWAELASRSQEQRRGGDGRSSQVSAGSTSSVYRATSEKVWPKANHAERRARPRARIRRVDELALTRCSSERSSGSIRVFHAVASSTWCPRLWSSPAQYDHQSRRKSGTTSNCGCFTVDRYTTVAASSLDGR